MLFPQSFHNKSNNKTRRRTAKNKKNTVRTCKYKARYVYRRTIYIQICMYISVYDIMAVFNTFCSFLIHEIYFEPRQK